MCPFVETCGGGPKSTERTVSFKVFENEELGTSSKKAMDNVIGPLQIEL